MVSELFIHVDKKLVFQVSYIHINWNALDSTYLNEYLMRYKGWLMNITAQDGDVSQDCVCVVCVYVNAERTETDSCLLSLFTYPLRQGLSMNLELINWQNQARVPGIFLSSIPQRQNNRHMPYHPVFFFTWCWHLNLKSLCLLNQHFPNYCDLPSPFRQGLHSAAKVNLELIALQFLSPDFFQYKQCFL